MNAATVWPAFSGAGIELEYAIVDRASLDVRPIADQLIRAETGVQANDAPRGDFGWSNELALHLIELKNNAPSASLDPLGAAFQAEVNAVNAHLAGFGARLMPAAMHPWMNPGLEMRLWPHEYAEIYATYDRLFDCRRHAWANMQSMHVNLPFADDAEFARLLTAVRCVLPILPALAASSPITDGAPTGMLDSRMHHYLTHAARIPAMMGEVLPELVESRAAYRSRILEPLYREIAPHDPDGVMQDEWLNARGAIARFDRNAIEIRVLDTQEHPQADIGVAAACIAVVRACYDGRLSDPARQAAIGTPALRAVLEACIRDADQASIDSPEYLALLGVTAPSIRAADLWRDLVERTLPRSAGAPAPWRAPLEHLLQHGPLARRILARTGAHPTPTRLREVYETLCGCLAEGRSLEAA